VSDDITFGEPEVVRGHDHADYLWQSPDGDPLLRVTIEDVHEKDGAIYGDITAWWLLDQPLGVRPVQPSTTLKLNSSHSTGWRSIPREVGKRLPGVDVEGAMTIAVHDEMANFRQGEPMERLTGEVDTSQRPFVLDPFISSSGVTVMYGEGGLSKSLVALALGISVSTGVPIFGQAPYVTGPVVYFDYEDDSRAHNTRLAAICRNFGINPADVELYHFPLTAKVTTSARIMRKKAEQTGAVMSVLDSVGMGRGGNAIAAEDTIRMFRALRSVGTPFVAIDHISKESKKDKAGDADPYGSVYTMNSARLAWSLTRSYDGEPTGISMFAKNTKANHVRLQKPRRIHVEYHNNEYGQPERISIETSDDFGMVRESVSVHQRMMMLLAQKPLTIDEMAEELGVARNTIDRVLSRDAGEDRPTFTKDRSTTPMQISLSDGLSDEDVRSVGDDETQ
jgi:hypothetical protein